MVPSRIKLMIGAVELSSCRERANAWRTDSVPVEYHWLRDYGVNTKHVILINRDELLGKPLHLGTIDLNIDHSDFLAFNAKLVMERDGVFHGLAGWFECELADEIWMTNSPLSDEAIRREQVFLSIEEPLEVHAGEPLNITIFVRPNDDLIAWTVEAPRSGRRFKHSNWKSLVMAKDEIARSQPDRIPKLNRTGLARKTVMGYCDGKHTSSEIQQAVLRDHPGMLPSREAISKFVLGELARDTE